jgi:hypothetical protein
MKNFADEFRREKIARKLCGRISAKKNCTKNFAEEFQRGKNCTKMLRTNFSVKKKRRGIFCFRAAMKK